jgi:HEAT repeat protein
VLRLFRIHDERGAATGRYFSMDWALESGATTAALIDTLAEAKDDQGILHTVIYVLGLKGDPDAFEPLLRYLGTEFEYQTPDGSESTQGLAADSIGKIGLAVRRAGGSCPRWVGEALVRSHHPGASSWIISAIAAVGYADGADLLLRSLTSPSWGDRHAAAWALGELGDPSAIDPLTRALATERDATVRRNMIDALARLEA